MRRHQDGWFVHIYKLSLAWPLYNFLFCWLFKDAVIIMQCRRVEWVINWKARSAIPQLAWRGLGKPRKLPIEIAGVLLEVPTKHFPNISLGYYRQTYLSGRSRDSSVDIATSYGLGDREIGVRVPIRARIFSSPRRPDQLWGPPNLLYDGYRG
jgi:hypothetical protein